MPFSKVLVARAERYDLDDVRTSVLKGLRDTACAGGRVRSKTSSQNERGDRVARQVMQRDLLAMTIRALRTFRFTGFDLGPSDIDVTRGASRRRRRVGRSSPLALPATQVP